MEWTHQFRVKATMDEIYSRGFAADKWFSFYPEYRGVHSVDSHWLDPGSTIVVRYELVPRKTILLSQTVIQHDRGRRIQFFEEGLGGLWNDWPQFDFSPQSDGSVEVTLTVTPTSRFPVALPIIWLISQPFTKLTPKAMQAFASMIEGNDTPH